MNNPTNPLQSAAELPLSRGHKKRERTRRGLVDAALRLFSRKDVGDIALLEVAEEAEVSNGTIYNYFRTREEVVEAVGLAMATEFSDIISELCKDVHNGAQRLAIGVRMFILRASKDPEWVVALLRIFHFDRAMRSRLSTYVINDLRDGLAEGDLDYEDEGAAFDLVLSCTIGAMRAVVEGRKAKHHDVCVAEMILKALGVPHAKAKTIAGMALPALS